MRSNNPLDQLKRLKDTPVAPEMLEHGRVKLQAFMAAHPLMPVTVAPWWKQAFVWKPAAAFAMMSLAVGGSAMAVSASEASMPGDSLYQVKVLAEQVRTRLAFSPEQQLRVQASLAEARLQEADMVIHSGSETPEVRAAHLKVAMDGYQNRMAVMNSIVAKLTGKENDPSKGAIVAVAAHEVERVLERHANLVDSASDAADVDNSLVIDAKGALELEDKVIKAEGEGDAQEVDMHAHTKSLRNRFEKLQEQDTNSQPADVTEGSDESEGHEHVETDAPSVVIPIVNQARIHLRGGFHAGSETNTNVETEATH